MEIQYGGKLEFGDLVAISDGNHLNFGFYAGRGIGGTFQYYPLHSPSVCYERYTEWLKMSDELKEKNHAYKQYKKGFTSKCIYKAYINAVHKTRIMRVTDPENVFTDSKDRELYDEAKEILIKIGMIKTT